MNNQYNFIRPYLRGWPIIVVAMVISYLLASKYLSYVTPMYESTAKLELADHNEGVSNSNLFKNFDVFANSEKIQTEIELIKSQAIIQKALNKLNVETTIVRQGKLKNTELFTDSPVEITKIHLGDKMMDKPFQLHVNDTMTYSITDPYGKLYQGKFADTLILDDASMVLNLNRPLMNKKPNLKIADNYTLTFNTLSAQVSEILKNLDVTSVDKEVPVIRISYKSSHPEKAALFSNALAQAYIEDYIESKYGAANVTSHFLDDRIKEISGKLMGTENAILNYREKEDITNIRQETETDLRKISELKIQQTNLKMSLDAIKELDQYMEKGKDNFLDLAPNFEAFTDLLSTEMIKRIKQLQSEKKDLLIEYTPSDEKVIAIDHKINDIASYLRESVSNTRKNLQSKYDDLVYDINDAQKAFITVPEKERIMTILNREFEIYQQSYNFLNQKKIEAEIAKAAKVAFHRVITPADISKMPVSPNKTIIKGVAVILGMLLAMFLIYIINSMKGRVNDIPTVESKSLIPVIASIPKFKNPSEKAKYFLTMLNQWQVKKLMQPKAIICFTGYNKNHAAQFIMNEVWQTLQNQGRKILIVTEQEDSNKSESWHSETRYGNTTELKLNMPKLIYKTSEEIQNLIRLKSLDHDQTVVLNSDFGEAFTLALMNISDLNIVCIDTRYTPANKIEEIDLMSLEYKLPQVYFAVNRVGYYPSFVSTIFKAMKNTLFSIKIVKTNDNVAQKFKGIGIS